MNKTTVVNIKTAKPDEWDIYIGRAMPRHKDPRVRAGSVFFNPFKISKKRTRKEVIEQYREYILYWLGKDKALLQELEALRGKRLGCWCKPKACHGDVLIELLDEVKL